MEELKSLLTDLFMDMEGAHISLSFSANGLGVLVYVLQALALYTIAQRRGIKKPWLAWIPLVNVWILGSVSDQYQYVVKGQIRNKRKALLGIGIAMCALSLIIACVAVGLLVTSLTLTLESLEHIVLTKSMILLLVEEHFALLILLALLALPVGVLGIIYVVFFYMALYDLYRSSDPNNSSWYLVVSLFGNIVTEGAYTVFLILCKDKDLGMPPRKPTPEVAAPAAEAVERPEE